MKPICKRTFDRGFSLIEIAIVLVIISVLITVVAIPISTQVEQQRVSNTNKQLEIIKEVLLAYAAANGRLPCPVLSALGVEEFAAGGDETNGSCKKYDGLLPAVTLGISPVDSSGFAVDAWGQAQNRIRYAVMDITTDTTFADCPVAAVPHVFTKRDGLKAATMGCISKYSGAVATSAKVLLTVCPQTPSNGSPPYCAPMLTNTAPFVLISLGKNAPTGGLTGDEAYNAGNSAGGSAGLVFVSRTPSAASAPGGEFDDIVTWPSVNTLFARMLQAGKLP